MKKIMRFFPALAIMIFAAGCGGGSMSSAGPKEVLTTFFERLSKKDIEGATELATKDSKSTMDLMKKGMDMAENMKGMAPEDTKEKDPAEEFKKVEIGDARIDGDNAYVPFKSEKASFEFPLKKEDGAWKVDFSMATLMKMGMQQMQNHNMMNEGDDSSNMENYDPEKMQENIKKGMEMMDSIKKNMDTEKLQEAMKAIQKMKEAQQ